MTALTQFRPRRLRGGSDEGSGGQSFGGKEVFSRAKKTWQSRRLCAPFDWGSLSHDEDIFVQKK